MTGLQEYDWPGNVRETENVVERAMVLSSGPVLALDDRLKSREQAGPEPGDSDSLKESERKHILSVLDQRRWKLKGRDNAADRLGLEPSTLRDRMKRLGIRRPESTV